MNGTERMRAVLRRDRRRGPASVVAHLVAVVGACLVSLAVLIGFTSAAGFQRERSRAVAQVQASAQLAAEGLGQPLASMPTFMEAIAAEPGVASFEPGRCAPALASYHKFGLGYVSLVRPDGSVVCSSEPQIVGVHRPFATAGWVATVLSNRQPINGMVVRDPLHGQAMFLEAVVMDGPGGQRGVLAGLLSPNFLSLGTTAPHVDIYVLDPGRSVILMTSSTAARLSGAPVPPALVRPLRPGAQVPGPDGRSRISAEASVAGAGWPVVAGIPTTTALAAARRQLISSIGLGLAAILIVLILGVLLHRRLARPIRDLTAAIDRARRGETSEAPLRGPRELTEVAAAFNGMIAERHAFEQYLAQQAVRDPLTGLPNRAFVLDQLDHALRRPDATVAAAFLDLDRFKLVNDSHGHAVGDHVLVCLGERIRRALGPGQTVARFGGDEFVVVADPLLETTESLAHRLSATLVEPFNHNGQDIFLSGSVGLALSGQAETPEELLAEADAAMYRAKERGRACFVVFDHTMRARAQARLSTEAGLHRALERDELVLQYQPVLSLSTGLVHGAEALLRWQHPERGLVGPMEFIDVAEETGLIVPIGDWVLRRACEQAVAWTPGDLAIAVNLSVRQLAQPGLARQVHRILRETGLSPARLCLEVTESLLIDDAEGAARVLQSLHDLGVTLSIDDFGTGYSSLAYLQRYPIDQVKIDRSFVAQLDGDEAIVRSIIELSHALRLEVVAEGIETLPQLTTLRRLGCDLAQGYYIGRPGKADQLGGPIRTPSAVA